jgi:hypothetical protein
LRVPSHNGLRPIDLEPIRRIHKHGNTLDETQGRMLEVWIGSAESFPHRDRTAIHLLADAPTLPTIDQPAFP